MQYVTTVIVILLGYSHYCTAFTKDLRSFTADFDRQNDSTVHITFDRVMRSISKISEVLCETLVCQYPSNSTSLTTALQSLIEEKRSTTLSIILEDYYRRIDSVTSYKWLEFSDEKTQIDSFESREEVAALRYGRVKPRQQCIRNGSQSDFQSKGCLLADIFPISELQSLANGEQKSLEYWISATERLFNGEFFDHAEAIAYFIVNFSSSSGLYLKEDEYFIKALIIITEVNKEKGYLSESVYFGLQVIDSYSPSSMKSVLHRLRLLLTVPPIPPEDDFAKIMRKEMLLDLCEFLEDIKEDSLSLTLNELSSGILGTPFHIAHQGLNDLDIQEVLSRIYTYLCPELNFLSPHLEQKAFDIENNRKNKEDLDKDYRIDDSGEGTYVADDMHDIISDTTDHADNVILTKETVIPIRLGIVSAHMFDHSIGRILVELIVFLHEKGALLDRPVNIIVFFVDRNIVVDDKRSNYTEFCRTDYITNLLRYHLEDENFRCLPASLSVLHTEISREKLDFLIFADLGMDFTTYALAHARLARYQAAWWGHPVTSGIESIDFFFGLDIEVPLAAEDYYSEQLIRMEIMNSAPIKQAERSGTYNRNEILKGMGLPKEVSLSLVLGRLFKLHPNFDVVLAGILILSPETSMVILIAEKINDWNQLIYDRIYNRVIDLLKGTYNIDSNIADTSHDTSITRLHPDNSETPQFKLLAHADLIIKKLRFLNYDFYGDLLQVATVILDTFPYGGCLTTHDAFSSGIPMVTLPSEHVQGRYTLGMYHQMGLKDLVAQNITHYINLTMRLLQDKKFHREQSDKISHHYVNDLHKNSLVADEWLGIISRIIKSELP